MPPSNTYDAGIDVRGRGRIIYLALEFVVLFLILPSLYVYFWPISIHPIPAVWCIAAVCAWQLRRDGRFSADRFWGTLPGKKQILVAIARFALAAVLLGLFVMVFEPERLLDYPKRSPVPWLAFILLYPVLSAVPQGIVFRAFIFHRYRDLFGNGWAMIAASALVFCYAHIIYRNPVALILTLGGGLIFAHSYAKSRSLFFSSMEHGLYGNFIFTIGLGYYIYSGAIR
jgi:membrane protease YdiL (CAAX protease family)